jgi:hypothetical protein
MITSTAIEIVHDATGKTNVFNTNFYVPDAAAVHVSVNAVELPAWLFRVSGLRLSAGASVTLSEMPAAGVPVRIWRKTAPLVQDYDFQYNESMPSEVIGFALDRLFCAVQEAAAGAAGFATRGELEAAVSRLDLAKAEKTDPRFHTHDNKVALDKIGEAAGAPMWNGMQWPVPEFRTGFAELDLSDQMDGARMVFSAGVTLRPEVPISLYYAGQRQLAGVNYTVDYEAGTLTTLFDSAPDAGDGRRLVVVVGNYDSVSALQSMIMAIWPVGSIFIHYNPTNPAQIFGFGTWVRIAPGRTLVGVSEGDTDFGAAGRESGAKTVTLARANLPSVSVGIPQVAVQMNPVTGHAHGITGAIPAGNGATGTDRALASLNRDANYYGKKASSTDSGGGHTPTGFVPWHYTDPLGSAAPVTNVQPSLAIYIWRRTA